MMVGVGDRFQKMQRMAQDGDLEPQRGFQVHKEKLQLNRRYVRLEGRNKELDQQHPIDEVAKTNFEIEKLNNLMEMGEIKIALARLNNKDAPVDDIIDEIVKLNEQRVQQEEKLKKLKQSLKQS